MIDVRNANYVHLRMLVRVEGFLKLFTAAHGLVDYSGLGQCDDLTQSLNEELAKPPDEDELSDLAAVGWPLEWRRRMADAFHEELARGKDEVVGFFNIRLRAERSLTATPYARGNPVPPF